MASFGNPSCFGSVWISQPVLAFERLIRMVNFMLLTMVINLIWIKQNLEMQSVL